MFALVVALLAVLVAFVLRLHRKPKNFPPGPPWVPFLGSVPFVTMENFHFTMEKLRVKFGPVVGIQFGTRNVVLVCAAEEVEQVLKRDEFQGRPALLRDEGVMFSEGDFWMYQRRFTVRHLRDFGFGKNSIEEIILEEVDDFIKNRLNSKRAQVSGLFNLSAVNILWAMMGGKRFSHGDPELDRLLQCIQTRFRNGTAQGPFSFRHPILAKFLPFLKDVRIETDMQSLIKDFIMKSFKEHRETMEAEPRDLIDVYLKELDSSKQLHPSFSEETLLNICNDFFSAGSESSGNSLGFAMLYAVLYPDWQEELYNEIISVIGTERKVSLNDRQCLHKVEAFLSEVSRSNSIANLTVPHKAIVDTTLNEFDIPKDTMLLVSLWSVLHDKKLWGDPENFRPERFLDSDGSYVKNKALMVFGAGKRACPGESLAKSFIFLFFTSMIQEFQFAVPEGHPKPSTVCLSGFTQAARPFEVSIRRRSH